MLFKQLYCLWHTEIVNVNSYVFHHLSCLDVSNNALFC